METETQTKSVAKTQIIVTVSEEQKATIQQLKTDYNLTDKGAIALLIEVAFNNQIGLLPDDNGDAQEVDTFAIVVDGLGLAKKTKAEKVVVSDEEKALQKSIKKQERIRKKMESLIEQLKKESGEIITSEDDVETLVVSGV